MISGQGQSQQPPLPTQLLVSTLCTYLPELLQQHAATSQRDESQVVSEKDSVRYTRSFWALLLHLAWP